MTRRWLVWVGGWLGGWVWWVLQVMSAARAIDGEGFNKYEQVGSCGAVDGGHRPLLVLSLMPVVLVVLLLLLVLQVLRSSDGVACACGWQVALAMGAVVAWTVMNALKIQEQGRINNFSTFWQVGG